ncbi:hypothetical protein Vadar_019426 [Vaccinium darrowii]|uniref:Uncharacterized protein n=1 Tax=Vaccinium darrowii TaxID=229202 RepID=A0ACB7Z689_9ERIC|nr:hypothetical protein Vadar_019426 [Vaccinium darrowii]
MALIEAALAAARFSLSSPSQLQKKRGLFSLLLCSRSGGCQRRNNPVRPAATLMTPAAVVVHGRGTEFLSHYCTSLGGTEGQPLLNLAITESVQQPTMVMESCKDDNTFSATTPNESDQVMESGKDKSFSATRRNKCAQGAQPMLLSQTRTSINDMDIDDIVKPQDMDIDDNVKPQDMEHDDIQDMEVDKYDDRLNNKRPNECAQDNLPEAKRQKLDKLGTFYWNWMPRLKLFPVKNQGLRHICWSIVVADCIALGYHIKKPKPLVNLSSQELLDRCEPKFLVDYTYDLRSAFEYVVKDGLCVEKDFPYLGKKGKYRPKTKMEQLKSVKITGTRVVNHLDEIALENAVKGCPVAGGVRLTKDFMNLKDSDVCEMTGELRRDSKGNVENHAILIVGYGCTFSDAVQVFVMDSLDIVGLMIMKCLRGWGFGYVLSPRLSFGI